MFEPVIKTPPLPHQQYEHAHSAYGHAKPGQQTSSLITHIGAARDTQTNGRDLVMTLCVCPSFFAKLPPVMQSRMIPVRAVMFTQGINEMQSIANSIRSYGIQDEINNQSIKHLENYFTTYRAWHTSQFKRSEWGKGGQERGTDLVPPLQP